MSEKINFLAIERRTRQAYYEDGLLEIVMGLYVIMTGALYQVGISPGLSVLLIFGMLVGMRTAKRRFVFPRIGYANLEQDKTKTKQDAWGAVLVVGGALLLLALIALFFYLYFGVSQGREYLYFRFIPAFVGTLFATALFALARQNGIRRWVVLGVWFLLIGFAVMLGNFASFEDLLAAQLSVSGVLPLLLGVGLFVRFVRRYPVLAESEVQDV